MKAYVVFTMLLLLVSVIDCMHEINAAKEGRSMPISQPSAGSAQARMAVLIALIVWGCWCVLTADSIN